MARPAAVDAPSLARRAQAIIQGARPLLRPVINATGILLHTGLGRAPLAEEAVEAVSAVARGYCNLEFELEQGRAGPADLGGGTAPARADGCRGGNRGEQQRRCHGPGPASPGGGPRGDRLARTARRDRRQLPAAGDLRGLRRQAARGGHDEQDPAGRLRAGDRAPDRGHPAGFTTATSGSSASPRRRRSRAWSSSLTATACS